MSLAGWRWTRWLQNQLDGASKRQAERTRRRRYDAAVARYEQRHARCLDRHGEACETEVCRGD